MPKIGDLMQKLFMSNSKTAMWFLSHASPGFWERKGKQKALTTFHEAAQKVPAYRKFLKEKGVNPEEIKTFEDFQEKVPIIDKESYLLKYDIKELCLERLDRMYTLSTSSGTTTKPCLWFRTPKQDLMLPKYWEAFFIQNWKINQRSTFVVVATALGNWIAGELVATTLKRLALEGKYAMTIATPGSDIDQILDIIDLGKNYDQIILVIYPTFIKTLFEKGEEKGVAWKDLNIKLWVGGERLSPYLRKYVIKKLGKEKEELDRIAFVYGTADAGGIGFSSPLSNLIARWAFEDSSLAQSLFGPTGLPPTLIQVNPLAYFIEKMNKILVITYSGGIPLVRYNLKDEGGIISYPKAVEILQKQGYDFASQLEKEGFGKETIWKWPFVYITGRVENVVKIIGANIYPENVEAALYEKGTEEINDFRLKVETGKEGNTYFYILAELKAGIPLTLKEKTSLEKKYHDVFLNKLLEVNRDYKKAYEEDKKTADPVIEVYQFDQGPFAKKLATKKISIEK